MTRYPGPAMAVLCLLWLVVRSTFTGAWMFLFVPRGNYYAVTSLDGETYFTRSYPK